MKRKRMIPLFKIARKFRDYDEYPVLSADIDPQVHVSRNSIAQPFYLICEQDTLLVQLTGKSQIHFKNSNVARFGLGPADCIYIPGGTPTRLIPSEESIQLRYKARDPGLEGVAWYCDGCGEEMHREVWDTGRELSQSAYLRACTAVNADEGLRTCNKCGEKKSSIDLSGIRWAEVSSMLHELEDN